MTNKYKIYGLIDPRTNNICYIGITRSTLKKRLSQHNCPKITNCSKIAKLRKHLQKLNMKFSIVLIDVAKNENEMYNKEIYYINHFKNNLKVKLYNIQDGGKITINSKESYTKFKSTRLENKLKGLHQNIKGENSNHNILSKKEVLNIYNLIKQGYSNSDIHELFKDKITISVVKSLRSGQNWKHLYKDNFKEPILSIRNDKNSYNGKIKIKILELLLKGYSEKHINKWFPKVSKSDLKRIKNKVIWSSVWKVYEQISAVNK